MWETKEGETNRIIFNLIKLQVKLYIWIKKYIFFHTLKYIIIKYYIKYLINTIF